MSQQLQAELRRAADDGDEAAGTALRDGPIRARLEAAIRALAAHRGPDSSTCPSDAARAVGVDDWRTVMDDAREIARDLARAGVVEITQQGEVVDPDSGWHGPVRIRIVRR
jgi:hypothetical protein